MEAETASESCLTNTTTKGPIYIYLCVCVRVCVCVCVCVCVRERETGQWHYFVSDLWTDVCWNEWNNRKSSRSRKREKKDVFYTESTEKEQSLWATETANVSTWNVIAGPLATFTSNHPSSNPSRTILSTGRREGGYRRGVKWQRIHSSTCAVLGDSE